MNFLVFEFAIVFGKLNNIQNIYQSSFNENLALVAPTPIT